jgi:hypothetical protein
MVSLVLFWDEGTALAGLMLFFAKHYEREASWATLF